MAVQITYDGKTTTVDDGKIATMACGGKIMETDVVVSAGGSGGGEVPETVEEYDGTVTVVGEPIAPVVPEVVEDYDGTVTVTGEPIAPVVPETVEDYDGTITIGSGSGGGGGTGDNNPGGGTNPEETPIS